MTLPERSRPLWSTRAPTARRDVRLVRRATGRAGRIGGQGSVRAVLDIDSDQLTFFTSEDVRHLSDILDNSFALAWQGSAWI